MSNQLSSRRRGHGALVVFPGALGDLVCLFPALRGLRERLGQPVTLLCKGDLLPLVRAAGVGDGSAIEGRRGAWLFQRDPPEEAADFFSSFARVDCFTGFGDPQVERNLADWVGPSARLHPFRPTEPIHIGLHFVRRLVSPRAASDPTLPRLSCAGALAEIARDRFASQPRPFLALHPGSGAMAKRWSRSGFVQLARRWRQRLRDVVVLLGPAEAAEPEWWRRHGLRTYDALDLVSLGVLIGESALYLGNDSGASHLAAALGARGVALFGPTDPGLWRPLSSRVTPLRIHPWNECAEAPAEAAVEAVERALAAAVDLA